MARWLDKKRRKRSGRYIVATRMRLAAPQAVADWLCEFAHLIDRGVRSETMTYEEAQDAKRAENGEIEAFAELYPHRETPWACFLTLHYLNNRPAVADRLLNASDILGAAGTLRKEAPGYERLVVRGETTHQSEAVLHAVDRWLTDAQQAVERAEKTRNAALAFCYAVQQKYRARQTALRTSRESRATAEEVVTPAVAEAALDDASNLVAADDEKIRHLRRHAMEGNTRAKYELGLACLDSDDVALIDREGIMWLERAAADGSARARLKLGKIYAEGTHVRHDPILALAWLALAKEQDQAGAGDAYERVAQQMSPWQLAAADWLQDQLRNGGARALYGPTAHERRAVADA